MQSKITNKIKDSKNPNKKIHNLQINENHKEAQNEEVDHDKFHRFERRNFIYCPSETL